MSEAMGFKLNLVSLNTQSGVLCG